MESEKKHERFRKIAEARTNKIINMVRLLGNCSNRANYAYTDSEVKQIFEAISRELDEAKSKFKENSTTKKKFVLK